MSEDEFFKEIQEGFLQEASDLLGRVEALSLSLEKDPTSEETYAELARLAHNFKGSGKAVGFDHISKLGHRLEDFILAIKNKIIMPSSSHIDFLFKCLDTLKNDIDRLIQDKSTHLDYCDVFIEIDGRLSGKENLQGSEEKNKELTVVEVNRAAPAKKLENINSELEKKKEPIEVLRIQKPKIDFLLEAFGEQVILQSTLEQCKFDIDTRKDLLVKTISQLTKLTFELQSHALSLTMVQLGPVFTKLERAIRDAARICNKTVNVNVSGAETEVDKTLIDQLSDSLTHMVRNAVDHAIEDESVRLEKGKFANGNIHINAKRVGGQLWIEITDDGKGLVPEILKSKAIKNGLIKPETAEKLTAQECYQLIFLNGFSTKEQVSEVSGRGVGMNVVSESVAGLKGTIDIESVVDKGTTFRLKLPLSLAIFNGAVVRINNNKFVIPNSEIAEIGRIDLATRIQLDNQDFAIKIREEVFRLIDLRQRLFVKNEITKKNNTKTNLFPVLISRKSGNKAFLVDEILGMQKVVQKPLGDEVKSRAEFAAGTILSDGSPGVILNLQVLGDCA